MPDAKQADAPTTPRIDNGRETRDARGEWMPRVLGKAMPFAWPLQPRKLVRFLLGYPGFLWPFGAAAYYGLAALTWRYLQPGSDDVSSFAQLRLEWILPMYVRNLLMLLVTAGTLYLILYWRRVQGTRFKYNSRWPSTNSTAFKFGDQVKDNMFWTLASGGTIWTFYEVFMLWAYGNGWVQFTTFGNDPLWFIALLWPCYSRSGRICTSTSYIVSRTGNRSTTAPITSTTATRTSAPGRACPCIPSSICLLHSLDHPVRRALASIHMFYLMQRPAINPALGHTGFDRIVLKEENEGLSVDSYFHYLHHRFFECNYGTATVPLDRWFGTLHDGTSESYDRMRQKKQPPAEVDTARA